MHSFAKWTSRISISYDNIIIKWCLIVCVFIIATFIVDNFIITTFIVGILIFAIAIFCCTTTFRSLIPILRSICLTRCRDVDRLVVKLIHLVVFSIRLYVVDVGLILC